MNDFLRSRSLSLSMVVLVLIFTVILQAGISYTLTFGKLDVFITPVSRDLVVRGWLGLRIALMVMIMVLWTFKRMASLFKAIIVTNGVLTLGLLTSTVAVASTLGAVSSKTAVSLLGDVVALAVSNILIFSIWYWIIDPPGIHEIQRLDEPWDFLFPQRGGDLPNYEDWMPRYTDYLYLAFTTTLAFSPTDTQPLTRRAKLLMLLQASVSVVTIMVIASSAIGTLAGSAGGGGS